ncbi:MAG: DUF2851 family protein, partial [Ktedonobacterales bacterium]|nr:DUF2851 family protein [Ktedonobacterales bacterium]
MAMHARRVREREAEFAAAWAAGAWRGQVLRAESGECYTMVYQGRPGGGAGPDFRDAVLALPDGTRLGGDIELHLRAASWQAHGHDRDPRYNTVVLHVARAAAATTAGTPLASGRLAPLVVLRPGPLCPGPEERVPPPPWPCAELCARLGAARVRTLLLDEGMARLASRAEALRCALEAARGVGVRSDSSPWAADDGVLFVALAEALAYGRDRAALRAAGVQLAAGQPPQALLAESTRLPRVERLRLRGLIALYERWQGEGPWHPLRLAMLAGSPRAAGRALSARLRTDGGWVSPGRAAILTVNVTLPFAVAWARAEGDRALAARAEAIYT